MTKSPPSFPSILEASSISSKPLPQPPFVIGVDDCSPKSPKESSSGRHKKRRKSRASNKAPLQIFSADASNFMVMVHRLTGISSHSSLTFDPPTSKLFPSVQSLPAVGTSPGILSRWSHDYGRGDYSLNSLSVSSSQQQSGMANLTPGYQQLNNNAGSIHASLPSLWEAVDRQRTHDGNYLNGRECLPGRESISYVSKTEADLIRSGEFSGSENMFSGYEVPVDTWLSGTINKKEFE